MDHLLDLPATRGRLHALAAVGVLDREELERSVRELDHRPEPGSWSRYLYWHALVLGLVLLLAGAVFFVAANWSALGGFARMGIVGGAMILATLVGGYLGDTLAGRAMTLLGGLLFGPLYAVYGQVYQTGADAWELFAWWTAVLVATGALVRFVGTWMVALLGLHLTCFLWIDQALGLEPYEGEGAWIVAGLAMVDAVFVALAERFTEDRQRRILARGAAFCGLGVALPFGVITLSEGPPEGGVPGLLVLLGGLIAIWIIYRWRRPDLGMLAALAAMVTILVSVAFGKLFLDVLEAELFGVAMLGGVVCVQVWGFTRWLLAWRREHGHGAVDSSIDSRRPPP